MKEKVVIKMTSTVCLNDDCLEVLKSLPDNTVDSLVTDPPAGISFMGKDWDGDKGGRDQWIAWMTEIMRECHRVLKPGAHGLVWALPRTSHWTATALEDAGFEIRDVVTHLFGTGFPKSMDISKAIDKAAGAEREVIGVYASPEGTSGRSDGSGSGFGIGGLNPITAPATDAAKQWQGWGTALKPASEHWILVRKPCNEKTVAANVLKWGTGGINIDGCRVGTEERTYSSTSNPGGNGQRLQGGDGRNPETALAYSEKSRARPPTTVSGRFPANLVLDEEAAVALDEQSGFLHASGNKNKGLGKGGKSMFAIGEGSFGQSTDYKDGGASRFFYVAKASKSDKGDANTHPTVKSTALMSYLIKLVTPTNGIVLDPFMGSGTTGVASVRLGFMFIGVEKDPNYFNIAESRVTAETEKQCGKANSNQNAS